MTGLCNLPLMRAICQEHVPQIALLADSVSCVEYGGRVG